MALFSLTVNKPWKMLSMPPTIRFLRRFTLIVKCLITRKWNHVPIRAQSRGVYLPYPLYLEASLPLNHLVQVLCHQYRLSRLMTLTRPHPLPRTHHQNDLLLNALCNHYFEPCLLTLSTNNKLFIRQLAMLICHPPRTLASRIQFLPYLLIV